MTLGADTQTDRHTYQRANKNNFKKPDVHGLRLCTPSLKTYNNIYLVFYIIGSIVKPYVHYIFGLFNIIKHVKYVEVIAYLPFTVIVAVLLMFPKTLEASHA